MQKQFPTLEDFKGAMINDLQGVITKREFASFLKKYGGHL